MANGILDHSCRSTRGSLQIGATTPLYILKCMALGLSVLFVQVACAVEDGETIAWFPFDADALSIANPTCNPDSVIQFIREGGAITFNEDETRKYVMDATGNPVRQGTSKYMTIDKGRLYVNLDKFDLGPEVSSVTFEMFVRKSENGTISNWDEVMWLDKSDTPTSQDFYSKQSTSRLFYIQKETDAGRVYVKIGENSGGGQAQPTLLNGEWRHVAVTVEPKEGDATKSTVKLYVNYELSSTMTLNSPWKGAAGSSYYLALGSRNGKGTIDFDELRITKGILAEKDFIRLSPSLRPEDGEALFYLPFDSDLKTIVRPEDDLGSVTTGTPVYNKATWKNAVVENGDRSVFVRKENQGCLYANKSTVTRTLPNQWMHNSECKSATIEFFIKGSAVQGEMAKWENKLFFTQVNGRYPFLVQADDNLNYYLRVDTDSANGGAYTSVKMNDGKWHHIAATIEPLEDGAKTKISYYVDYGSPIIKTLSGVWLGFPKSGLLSAGTSGSVIWVDELRISQGVLPTSKFLKAHSNYGLILVVR